MPTFQTPEPITAVVEVVAGSVRLVATDRDDTVVEIRPRDPSRASDVRIAEQARTDFRNGTLVVSAGRRFISLGRGGAVNIDIELPSHSRLQASAASAEVHAAGEYAECEMASASGDLTVELLPENSRRTRHLAVSLLTPSRALRPSRQRLAIRRSVSWVATSSFARPAARCGSSGCTATSTRRLRRGTSQSRPLCGAVSVQTSSGEVEVDIAEGTAAQLDVHRIRCCAQHPAAIRRASRR